MDKQSKKKITWTIKNFSSFLRSKKIYSDNFVVGGCKWRLCACSKGNDADYIFLFLEVADFETLPFGWRRHVRYLLSLVNYNSVKRSKQNEAQKLFDDKSPRWGHLSMFPINEIQAKGSGFLINEELKIVAEVEVLEVIGDVSEVPSTIMETMDVNGFHLLSSQVDFVSHMFERQPEIASNFSAKNPHLRTGYMSLLLSLIETLRQSPNELHMADLAQADLALRYLTLAGFKLDWLEKKFDEMIEKRRKEKAGETQMQETEEKLEDLKHKCSVLEAQLAKEKAEVSAAKSPISFEDVI